MMLVGERVRDIIEDGDTRFFYAQDLGQEIPPAGAQKIKMKVDAVEIVLGDEIADGEAFEDMDVTQAVHDAGEGVLVGAPALAVGGVSEAQDGAAGALEGVVVILAGAFAEFFGLVGGEGEELGKGRAFRAEDGEEISDLVGAVVVDFEGGPGL